MATTGDPELAVDNDGAFSGTAGGWCRPGLYNTQTNTRWRCFYIDRRRRS